MAKTNKVKQNRLKKNKKNQLKRDKIVLKNAEVLKSLKNDSVIK